MALDEETQKLIDEFGGQYKASTSKTYKRSVVEFQEKFNEVSKGNILDFFEYKLSQNIRKTTMDIVVHSLKQWVLFLHKKGLTGIGDLFKEEDFKKRTKTIKKQCLKKRGYKPFPTYISKEELERMFVSADSEEYDLYAASSNAVIALGAYAGLRRSEMANAKWSHLSEDWKKITVFGKTGRGEVFMNKKIIPILKRTRAAYEKWGLLSDYIVISVSNRNFGKQATGMGIHRRIQRIAKRAGVKQITTHDLRHYFANSMFDMKIKLSDIQKQMRHKSERSVIDYLVTHGNNKIEETQWAQ